MIMITAVLCGVCYKIITFFALRVPDTLYVDFDAQEDDKRGAKKPPINEVALTEQKEKLLERLQVLTELEKRYSIHFDEATEKDLKDLCRVQSQISAVLDKLEKIDNKLYSDGM